MSRRAGFVLERPKQGSGVILRIAQRKGSGGSLPQGYPFLLSRDEARLLLTLLRGFFGDFPHSPDGCVEAGCPCRRRKAAIERLEAAERRES